jgi:hypothetical protein
MMTRFLLRHRELRLLASELDRVRAGGDRPGRCLLPQGRRRVGKSRLVEEFVDRAKVAGLCFTAAGTSPIEDIQRLCADTAESTLPGRDLMAAANPQDWDGALRILAAALPEDAPSIVVIDEVPRPIGRHGESG